MTESEETEFLRALNRDLDELLELDEAGRSALLEARFRDNPDRAERLQRLLLAALSSERETRLEDRLRRRLEDQLFDDLSGTRFGPWQLDRRVAQGGMGVVYLGHRADGSFERVVAIKLLAPALLGLEAVFRREIALLAKLDHLNIARLLDGGADGSGRGFLVLEWVEGRSLAEFAKDESVSFDERIKAFEQLVDAVSYAHQHLVVHRDLKPANVRFDELGRPKLLDFGIAVVLDDQDQNSGTIAALTPGWAAPEQTSGGVITTRTDVHSLGRLLALMLGAPPAEPQSIESFELLRAPRRWRRELAAIIRKAGNPIAAERYPDASALLGDLLHLRQDRPISPLSQSWSYVLHCFARRNRWAVIASIAVISGMAMATAFSIEKANQATIALSAATLETARSDSVREFLLLSLGDAADRTGESTSLREALALATERVSEAYQSDPKQQVKILLSLAELNNQLSDFVSAIPLIERGIQMAKTQGLDLEFAELAYEFGIAAPRVGRAKEAIPLLVEAEAWWSQQPKDSAKYGRMLQLRGRIERSLGQQKAGLELTERGYRRIIADPNVVHRERAIAEQNLGVAYLQSGMITNARRYFEQAVLQFSAAHLQDTPMALDARNNLGAVLISEGYYLEAVHQLEHTAAARLAQFGESAALASCLSNLGKAQLLAGRVDDARPSFDRALPMLATFVGTESPDYAAALIGSADWALQTGDIERALRESSEAQQIVERVLDAGHPFQAVFHAMSARVRLATEPELAAAQLDQAIQRMLQFGSGAGQQMASVAVILATHEYVHGRHGERVSGLLIPVTRLAPEVLPETHPLRIESRLILALATDVREDAATAYRELVASLGSEHPRVRFWSQHAQ